MGPVVGPTFTRTCVTVPLPAGTSRLCAYVGPTEIVVHVHDWACVGTSSTAPGTNGDGIGQTEQSKGTFGCKVRSAPNVVTCAGTSRASRSSVAMSATRRIRSRCPTPAPSSPSRKQRLVDAGPPGVRSDRRDDDEVDAH